MYSRNQTPTKSRTSPKGGRRGCLCKDGTYNSKCCNGDLQNQGIGNITGEAPIGDEYYYKVQRCGHSMHKEIHLHNQQLVVGNVYYLEFENTGHSNCYTVLEVKTSGEQHVDTATLYNDCTACLTAHP